MCMKFFHVLCYFNCIIYKVNAFRVIQTSNLSFFCIYKGRRNTRDYILITVTNSLCYVLAHKQNICHPLSWCSSAFPYLCFFFSRHLMACSFFNHFTLASLTNFSYSFFSPTFRLFIQQISKFCYFFLFLSLKAVTSFLFLKPKNLSLTSFSIQDVLLF